MAIIAGCALVLLLSLVALYKKLAPISQHRDENVMVNATSKLSLAVMEHGFPGIQYSHTCIYTHVTIHDCVVYVHIACLAFIVLSIIFFNVCSLFVYSHVYYRS